MYKNLTINKIKKCYLILKIKLNIKIESNRKKIKSLSKVKL